VSAIGAKSFFLDAAEHDSYAAAISHIPLVASIALFNLAKNSVAWPELASMTGPAFRDLTRLASGEPEMAHDIFLTNRSNVRHWLDRYIEQLQGLAALIEDEEEGGSETLFKSLDETQKERDNYNESPPNREELGPDLDIPSSGEAFMSMMAGTLWRDRAKEITGAVEERRKQREMEDRMKRRTD
jgi:hypothetical protein